MRDLLLRFRKARDGLAAVEFALLLPVMITLFFGVVEVSLALSCRADVTNMASTAADLVAQESAATPSDLANVFKASNAILYPYPANKAVISVFSIVDNSTPAGKVAWSCIWTGSANNGAGSAVAGPTGASAAPTGTTGGDMIKATNLVNGVPAYGGSGSVILVKVDYTYSSPTTKVITGDMQMTNLFYTKPRRVPVIAAPSACSA